MVDLERIKAETVAYFRALDESATLRHHFRASDEDGGLWYFEAAPDRGELIAIKQAKATILPNTWREMQSGPPTPSADRHARSTSGDVSGISR
ncbi:hypothetical protein ABZ322_31160 [Streptomyces sp. NPDC006129]|uniref:hypothetical protein n=1 Tax=Streptomyces sp. NPDC006129 TaxID=3155348 RepID=UPI0033A9E5E8